MPVDDFYEPRPHKQSLSKRKGRKRVCAKSKSGEVCNYTKRVTKSRWWSKVNKMWTVYAVMSCERCGRQKGWYYYQTRLPNG